MGVDAPGHMTACGVASLLAAHRMDLLAGYGSDGGSDSDQEELPVRSAAASVMAAPSAAPAIAEPPQRSGGLGLPRPQSSGLGLPKPQGSGLGLGLPKPKAAAAAGLPAGFFDAGAPALDEDAPAAAPRPRVVSAPRGQDDDAATDAPGPAALPPRSAPVSGLEDLSQPDAKLWSKLPKAGGGATSASGAVGPQPAGKRRVAFQSPLLARAAELLRADSDGEEDDKPAAKRARPEPGAGLLSFLPAPKHAGAERSGGGARLQTGSAAGSKQQQQQEEQQQAEVGGAPSASNPNDAFRVEAGGAEAAHPAAVHAAGQYAAGQYAAGQYAAGQYAYGAQQQQQQQPAAGRAAAGQQGADMDELLAAALQEEADRAARRGGASSMATNLKFKEVNAATLKYVEPMAMAAGDGMREALGSDYAQQLRAAAAPFQGDKMAKRKHQIGTLFHNAKMQELEILEQRAQGVCVGGFFSGGASGAAAVFWGRHAAWAGRGCAWCEVLAGSKGQRHPCSPLPLLFAARLVMCAW